MLDNILLGTLGVLVGLVVTFYGYGIFRGDPNPHQVSAYRKFNPMQSMM